MSSVKKGKLVKPSTNREDFRIIDGRHPTIESKTVQFKIQNSLILHMHKMGWQSFFNWRNLFYGLNQPCTIFKGLDRDGHKNSYCYVSRPERIWTGEGDNDWIDMKDELLFTVYIMDTYQVFNWKFEKHDQNEHSFPKDYQHRYDKLIWPKH